MASTENVGRFRTSSSADSSPPAASPAMVETPAKRGNRPQEQPEPGPDATTLAAGLKSLRDQVAELAAAASGSKNRLNKKLKVCFKRA